MIVKACDGDSVSHLSKDRVLQLLIDHHTVAIILTDSYL